MTVVDRSLTMAPSRTRRATRGAGKVAKAVVTHAPYWDVDLGSDQAIGQVHISFDTGATLRNFWVMISDDPIVSDNLLECLRNDSIWRSHQRDTVSGTLTVPVAAGVTGRYLRIHAAKGPTQLPIESLDIALPAPSADLNADEVTKANSKRRRTSVAHIASETGNTKTLDLQTTSGRAYTVSFDLPAQDTAVMAWWNGTLHTQEVFRTESAAARFSFDVIGTGADDRLTFQIFGDAEQGELPQNILLTPKVAGTAGRSQPEPAPEPQRGTLGGVLRRKAKPNSAARSYLEEVMGMAPLDEIVFR